MSERASTLRGFGLFRGHVADRAENAAFLGIRTHRTRELSVGCIVQIGELHQISKDGVFM